MILTNPAMYPLSQDFLHQMAASRIQRLVGCDWSLKPVLFFEGPFNAISGVCAGIVRNYETAVYWRSLYATCGVIDALCETELRVVVEHEQHEIEDVEKAYTNDDSLVAFTTLEAEAHRHEPELNDLRAKHGMAVDTASEKMRAAAQQHPLIPRYVLLFWKTLFLLERYEEFSSEAIPMTPLMVSDQGKNTFKSVLDQAMKEYGNRAPVEEWGKLLQSVLRAPASDA